MEEFYSLRNEIKSRFESHSCKPDETDDRLSDVVNFHLQRANKHDLKPLEVILDLTLTLVDERQYYSKRNYRQHASLEQESGYEQAVANHYHYDGDDEGSDEQFIFPCHLSCENCHPDQLLSYHHDHLKEYYHVSANAQIIKHSKLAEFVIDQLVENVRSMSNNNFNISDSSPLSRVPARPSIASNIDDYLRSIVNIFLRLEKVSIIESTNWRIMSKTTILDSLLDIIHSLIQKVPDKQSIYLDPLLRFAFRLANFKIIGSQLRQFYAIAKESSIQLDTFLKNLNKILIHQESIMKNLQPITSINFPCPSTTASEIYNNASISNSWHWRMRRKVLEFKKKLIRNIDPQMQARSSVERNPMSSSHQMAAPQAASIDNKSISGIERNLTPSWLECSLMTPLSNVSPLVHNNYYIKFSASLWVSLCGDLFVRTTTSSSSTTSFNSSQLNPPDASDCKPDNWSVPRDWRLARGQWLRLISNRRLARRRFNDRRRFTRSTTSTTRTARDIITPSRESDEEFELRSKQRKQQLQQIHGNKHLTHLNAIRTIVERSNDKLGKTATRDKSASRSTARNTRPNSKAATQGAASTTTTTLSPLKTPKRISHELLLHIISFAIDNMTIEIWLNIKSMLILAKLCRVGPDGQTAQLDSVEFCSFLESSGKWSHMVFSIEEEPAGTAPINQQSSRNTIYIQLTVNATHKVNSKLSYNTNRIQTASNFACLIGCERSTFGYVWKLSQVNLYRSLPSDEMILFLFGKGPDFATISNFRQASRQASLILPDLTKRSKSLLMNPSILELYGNLNEDRCLDWLCSNIISLYVAHKADYFLDYSQSNNRLLVNNTHSSNSSSVNYSINPNNNNSSNNFLQVEILNFTRTLKFNVNQGFGQAMQEAGGMECMLVLFADVIRRCPGESKVHSLALSNLLAMSETNQHHLMKFLDELDGLKLIEGLLAHPACIVSKTMLDVMFDFCIVKSDSQMQITLPSSPTHVQTIKPTCLIIKSSKLIYNFLGCWRAWHKDVRVAKRFYKKLYNLLLLTGRNSKTLMDSPQLMKARILQAEHNVRMVNEAGGLDILMNILKQCLVPMEDFVPKIDQEIVDLIVNLMSLLVCHPPTLDIIYDIMEFLLFLHPDHRAYVDTSSNRSSFFAKLNNFKSTNHHETASFYQSENQHQLYSSQYSPDGQQYYDDEDESGQLSETNSSLNSINNYQQQHETNQRHNKRGNSIKDDSLQFRRSTSSDFLQSYNEMDQFVTNNSFDRNDLNTYKQQQQQNPEGNNHHQQQKSLRSAAFTIIPGYELRQRNNVMLETLPENVQDDENQQQESIGKRLAPAKGEQQSCSHRSFAVGSIADMLASIVKLTPDSGNLLIQVFSKPIIDPRKLIILANNRSSFVREKVLRLFLYSMKACYSLELAQILHKFELTDDDSVKNSKFKICIPIELMARQLLSFPTSMKMIQLCYSIIVGVEDLEAVESFCFAFGIDTIDNNLKLNVLIMLFNIMTRLENEQEIVSAVIFSRMSAKQILQTGDAQLIAIVIQENLLDCLMKLYFSYIEHNGFRRSASLAKIVSQPKQNGDMNHANNVNKSSGDSLLLELDRTLMLIVKYYFEELETSYTIESLQTMMTYFDLISSHLRTKDQSVIRDRQVKVLFATLRYCKLYETSARDTKVRVNYYLSFFASRSIKFANKLAEFELELAANLTTTTMQSFHHSDELCNNHNKVVDGQPPTGINTNGYSDTFENQSGQEKSRENSTSSRAGNDRQATATITESDLIERYKAIVNLVINFIITREQGIIPSPFERQFIEYCIQFLSYILETSLHCNANGDGRSYHKARYAVEPDSHWFKMLAKLRNPIQASFAKLILYLLSPCDSMNRDERKYYAQKLLAMFGSPSKLLSLIDEESYKYLLLFLEDLIRSDSPLNDESESDDDGAGCSGSAEDDERGYDDDDEDEDQDDDHDCDLFRRGGGGGGGDDDDDDDDGIAFNYDTGRVLKAMISHIRSKLKLDQPQDYYATKNGQSNAVNIFGGVQSTLNGFSASPYNTANHKLDHKLLDIWLTDLQQLKEESRDQCQAFKFDYNNNARNTNKQMILSSTSTSLLSSPVPIGNDSELLLSDNNRSSNNNKSAMIILDEGLRITHGVVIDKHEQRKAYLESLKQEKVVNYHVRQQWLSLIIGQTHERSIWYMESHYPNSWELNPVEGPSRIRSRLRPTKLNLFPRFLRNQHQHQKSSTVDSESNEDKQSMYADDWYYLYSPHPLCALVVNPERSVLNATELRARMFTTDKIHMNCDCSIIRPDEVFDGEISIASWCMHFIGERKAPTIATRLNTNTPTTTVSAQSSFNSTSPMTMTIVEDFWFDEIVEIMDRRYQLRDVGMEIFLTNNMTYLLSFKNNKEREEFKNCLFREQSSKLINLQSKQTTSTTLNSSTSASTSATRTSSSGAAGAASSSLQQSGTTNLQRLTHLWRENCLTNFDFLTCLNKLAGRSFNDLMQYPVFPFVLSNYTGDFLDLTECGNFRNLRKPMAVQRAEKEQTFVNNYENFSSSNISLGLNSPVCQQAYHYGNHYSNTASVLHFLVRLPPFTQMMIQYQDNNFDQPDRTFHSIASTWQLITQDSNTDFKELIPEFFFLPEMFINFEGFDFGRKQNEELVDNVKLPPWCPRGDARLFTLIHRQALESDHVTSELNHWIDLIFGYKQTGKPAIDALNVFHPATYYGMIDLDHQQQQQQQQQHASSSHSGSLIETIFSSANNKTNNVSRSSLTSWKKLTNNGKMWRNKQDEQGHGDDNETIQNNSIIDGLGDEFTLKSASANSTLRRPKRRTDDSGSYIERLAMETMIKTYGQMPKQLYDQPVKPRQPFSNVNTVAPSSSSKSTKSYRKSIFSTVESQMSSSEQFTGRTMEPLAQVYGLKWGSFVGSPDENEIVVIKHKHIVNDSLCAPTSNASVLAKQAMQNQGSRTAKTMHNNKSNANHYCQRQRQPRYMLHLLPNGDIAIMSESSSLLLSNRANRISGSGSQLLAAQSSSQTKYSRRAGLNSLPRMNLFSSVLFSKQQFAYLVPTTNDEINATKTNTKAASHSAPATPGAIYTSLTAATKQQKALATKFSMDSLSKITWSHLDGTLRIRYPANDLNKANLPLAQADSAIDSMSACCSVPELNLLIVGYNSGAACAHIISTCFETTNTTGHHKVTTLNNNNSNSSSCDISRLSSSGLSIRTESPSQEPAGTAQLEPPGESKSGGLASLLSLGRQTTQTVRSVNKTSRWLYSHTKRVNCIRINIGFGIVVTGSDDGTSIIWDLNSLSYVRTLKYTSESLGEMRCNTSNDTQKSHHHQSASSNDDWMADFLCSCESKKRFERRGRYTKSNNLKSAIQTDRKCAMCQNCRSGVSLVAISNTLGDIATVKRFTNRQRLLLGGAANLRDKSPFIPHISESASNRDTQSNEDDGSTTSVIYVNTINGTLVGLVNSHTDVTAIAYSQAPEGISVNVIAVGLSNGAIRLYSSWDLTRVKEFHITNFGSPIASLLYSRDNQLLYSIYDTGDLLVLCNKKSANNTSTNSTKNSQPKEILL